MKKKIFLLSMLFLFISGADALAYNVGEVIGTAHYSAIDTYINNYPINAYNMDGRQLICAEDLRNYGFLVEWYGEERALYITPDYSTNEIYGDDIKKEFYLQYKRYKDIICSDIKVYINQEEIEGFSIDGEMMIKIRDLDRIGIVEYSFEENWSKATISGLPVGEYKPIPISYEKKPVIVLDPGHGKSSWTMTESEKINEGYTTKNGSWGEWRHWKNGSCMDDCQGYGCNKDYSCWYPIGNGDRNTEPEINLNNVMAAKEYLESYGYEVRLTRSSNAENPSFSKRVSYCYPYNDMTMEPDASCYVCVHSNAGGGRGSAYIEAKSNYTQKWINQGYTANSNKLGSMINEKIIANTSLTKHGSGKISGLGYMILFNKCPVPAGYLEIGFFDSKSDLDILRNESTNIGKAIADGIVEYMNS